MTGRDTHTPPTIARAIAVAALIGTAAIAVHDALAPVGAFVGFALVAATAAATSSHRRAGLASGVLVVVAAASVALVAVRAAEATVAAGVLTIASAAVGLAVGLLLTDGPTGETLERTGAAALYGAGTAGVGAGLLLATATVGGFGAVLSGATWGGGDGVVGLALRIVAAAGALVAAVFAVPPAAVTEPTHLTEHRRRRLAVAVAIGTATAGVLVLAGITTVVGWYVPPVAELLAWIAGSVVVRGLLLIVATAAVSASLLAVAVRGSWKRPGGTENYAVPLLVGSVAGVATLCGVAFAVGLSPLETLALLVGVAVLLAVGGVFTRIYGSLLAGEADDGDGTGATAAGSIVALALAAAGLVTGAGVDLTVGSRPFLEAAASLALLAMAAFVSDVGRYGRTLGREVGREGTTARPQFVRLGWSGVVAGVGLVVATVGLAVATLFAPVFSVPATAGVFVALGAVLVGSWLLFG
ncbi:hypothetical protein [Halobiforma nitratireducens]|uniref:Uncharacterized protein n=1 Tax=Halobiforma nitratireducens JCM 10879 TaxID=1227454 RepID=M0LYZ0_9EURY|nr:hypothetical protein [Halobiforma nitratireducens]EMA37340.1 hypothetical protein C446_10805 [Halobiforma nitratireducens JCM 10879]